MKEQVLRALMLFAFAGVSLPAEAGSENWRAEQPALGPSPDLVLPTFEREKLPNGLTVLVAQLDRLPLVAFSLVTKGGAALDPSDRYGLGALVYNMLEEGAGDLDALAFSDAVADLGASFSAGSGRDRGSVSISGLARQSDDLVKLLADAVLRPRLASEDLQRVKAETVASIERQLGSPRGLAFLRLPALVYGADHPLGHPPSGSIESVKKATAEDIKAHHARLLAPERSAFVAVGDITRKEAVEIAKRAFGDWSAPKAARLSIPPVEPQERKAFVLVNKPGSPQTMAILTRPVFGRGHPDEDALSLANRIWGGGFASRLNMNLREDKGYTYGAGSQVAFRNQVGVFVAYAALQAKFTAPGLKEFFLELDRLKEKPISNSELERVRKGLIRSLPGDFEGIGNLAGAAGQIFAYGLPLDHYARLAGRLEAVSVEASQAAAEAYLRPELMQVLLVGDAEKVQPELEKLGFSPIRVESPQ